MAEIPVTKKSGIPWWVWAILAAIILLLLFLFLGGDDADVAEVETDPVVVTGTETVGPDVITDLATIERGTAALAGRQVDVDGVRVASMAGDRGFTVTDDAGATVFVVLDEIVPGPDSGDDGDVDVNAGQTVDIRGEVFEVIDGAVDGEPIEGLPGGTDIFVYASEVSIEGR